MCIISLCYFVMRRVHYTVKSISLRRVTEQLSVCNITGGADKSLARTTSRCILFDGENISFAASLVIYIYK